MANLRGRQHPGQQRNIRPGCPGSRAAGAHHLPALRGSLDGNLPAGFFTDILRTHAGEDEAARQLDVAVNWGRYAELYAYDAARGQIIAKNMASAPPWLTGPNRPGAARCTCTWAPHQGPGRPSPCCGMAARCVITVRTS